MGSVQASESSSSLRVVEMRLLVAFLFLAETKAADEKRQIVDFAGPYRMPLPICLNTWNGV